MFYWYAEPVFFYLICSFVVHYILFWLLRWLLWDITSSENLFCVMTFTSDVWWSDLYLNELKWHLLQQGEKVIFKSVSAEIINTIDQNWVLVSVYTKYHCVVSSSGLLIIIFKAQHSALWLQQATGECRSLKEEKSRLLSCVTKITAPSLICSLFLVVLPDSL